MYAAGHLLEGPGGTYLDGRLQQLVDFPVEVDVYDRLATQWGLVRHGVAPDHPEKKLVQRVFEDTAARPGFRFYGNVEIGNHVRPTELAQWYDAVIYAHGAAGDSRLGIRGEQLPGCQSARAFVAWYNGHPDHADLEVDLSHERAVVVGNGNVALDVARILTQRVQNLAKTDIAPAALAALSRSRVREVVVLGRRAHFHGAFNNAELEELAHMADVDVVVESGDLPGEHEEVLGAMDAPTRRKVNTLQALGRGGSSDASRRIVLRFLSSPIEVVGHDRVEGLLVSRNHLEYDEQGHVSARPTGRQEVLEAGLVLRAVGYFGIPVPGMPFDQERGVIPHRDGRVLDHDEVLPGLYVTGWAKRGPRGIIGTNKKCARDTILSLLEDARAGRLPREGTLDSAALDARVHQRQPQLVDQRSWLSIDDHERRCGRAEGRPRAKFSDHQALLAAAGLADLP